jgi:hypothetical protein
MRELPDAFHATMRLLFCGCCTTHDLECSWSGNARSFSGWSDQAQAQERKETNGDIQPG